MLLKTIKPNKKNPTLLEHTDDYQLAMIDPASIYYARVVDKFRCTDEFGKGAIPKSVGLVHLNDGDVLGLELLEYNKIVNYIKDSCHSILVEDLGLTPFVTNLRNKIPYKDYSEDSRYVIIKDTNITSIRPANVMYDGLQEFTLKFTNDTAQNGVLSIPYYEAEALMNKCNPNANNMKYIDATDIISSIVSTMSHILDVLIKANTKLSVAHSNTIENNIDDIGTLFDSIISCTLNNGSRPEGVTSFYSIAVMDLVEKVDNLCKTQVFEVLQTISDEERGLQTLKHFSKHCVELYRLLGCLSKHISTTPPRMFCSDITDNANIESMKELREHMYVSEEDARKFIINKTDIYKDLHNVANLVMSIVIYHGYRGITDYRNKNITIPKKYAKMATAIYNDLISGKDFSVHEYNHILDLLAKTGLILDGDKERLENLQIMKWYKSKI